MRSLPPPSLHAPWLKGTYDVAPNLKPLGDAKAFEFDTRWPAIRANKCREASGRVLRSGLDEKAAEAVVLDLASRLAREWPECFACDQSLECLLTGERIPLAASGLDALALNVPCDLALVQRHDRRDWIAYLHVCAPSHWRPEEKIGLPFVAAHAPVPHFEKVNAAAPKLVEAMVSRGPWVRYVWGFETDMDLDHHPDRAKGRAFATEPFVVRVERQVSIPLPEHEASIFLVATGFASQETILADPSLWRPLLDALDGMSPQAREYKGVAAEFEGLRAQFPT